MDYRTLSSRHPCCDPPTCQRYDALYRGGKAFAAINKSFLPQNPMEAPAAYALRLRDSAAYRSYAGPIVDFFAAQLFASPFLIRSSRDGETVSAPDEFYAEVQEDCDLNGTDLVTFAKSRFIQAMVKGAAWVLAEKPDDGGIPAESRAEYDARGLGRVRLCPLDAEAVLDWECDDYGGLLWAITHKVERKRTDPRKGPRQAVTETWCLYDASTVETFQVTYDPKQRKLKPEDIIPSVGTRPHGFPRVPLVQLRLPDGLWLLNRIADAQVEHFRCSAAMSWLMRRTCYAMLVFKSKDQNRPPVTGPGFAIVVDAEESFDWIAPPVTAFEALAKEVLAQKDEIYRVAQQMAASVNNNAAALVRSGDSKQADAAAAEICLHAYASVVKCCIEEVSELISDGRGDIDLEFSIEGMNKFSLADITAALTNIKTAMSLGIDSETLTFELWSKAADMLVPDASQAVKDKIREELEEGAARRQAQREAPAPGQPPDGGNVPPQSTPQSARPTPDDDQGRRDENRRSTQRRAA